MKKVLVSLLIGASLLSVGCGGRLNINKDMVDYSEQFCEGTRIEGKGIMSTLGDGTEGIRYTTYFRGETMSEHFITFDYDVICEMYEKFNLSLGDYVEFEGVINENGEIDIENIKVIDSPTGGMK